VRWQPDTLRELSRKMEWTQIDPPGHFAECQRLIEFPVEDRARCLEPPCQMACITPLVPSAVFVQKIRAELQERSFHAQCEFRLACDRGK